MRNRSLSIAALAGAAILLTSCRSPRVESFDGQGLTYYTQFALQHERDRFRSTNYRVGELLPINTQVTLVSKSRSEIEVDVPSLGHHLVIEHIPKHTKDTLDEAFDRVLGQEPVDLRRFSEVELQAIENGEVVEGMSREAVLAAIGYPPASLTPDLDGQRWKYAVTRWNNFEVAFGNDGRVREIRR